METTGVRRISLAATLDRELRCQTGLTLESWAEGKGISARMLIAILEGRPSNARDDLLSELATTLGVSVASLSPRGGWTQPGKSRNL